MELIDFEYDNSIDLTLSGRKSSGKKRRWREIEAIHDKYRLQKELQSIDFSYNNLLEELEL